MTKTAVGLIQIRVSNQSGPNLGDLGQRAGNRPLGKTRRGS